MDVTGDPVFRFSLGNSGDTREGDAAYEGGTGTDKLVFGYTVVSTDVDNDGIFLLDDADLDAPDGPVRPDSDDEIEFKDTSIDVPLKWPEGRRGLRSNHKVDGSRTTGNVAPNFTSSTAFDAAENQTAVGTVAATDSDSDDSVTGYAIAGGADMALFEIGATSGELAFKTAPDFEDPDTDNVHEVTVRATSGTGTRVMTADQTITVTVTDAAEQSAKPAAPTLAKVSGSSTSLTATWEPPDKNGGPAITGYKLEYKLSTETSWTAFAHTGTAVTTTITGLTADTSYQARVRAENGETDSDWSDASDAVSTNAETVTPTCTLDPAAGDLWCGVVTVEAITIGGVVVGHGFGAGAGDLSDKTFDIGTNSYTIDGVAVTSGALSFSLTSALTAAEKEKLVLHMGSSTFAFSDAGAPTSTFNYQWPPSSLDWTSETSVTLRLREANTAPVFAECCAQYNLPENSAANTAVGRLTATDADDDTLTYSLEGTDAASFDIDSGTGQIETKSGVTYDFEAAQNIYYMTVKADDGNGGTDTIDVTIALLDADEKSAKPAKPVLARVTGSSTSLTATWEKPDLNGGPDITGYDLQYRAAPAGTWMDFAHSDTAVTTTITGLTADTSYQARVRAENGDTDSDWSDASDAVSTNAETVTPTCTLDPGDIWCGVLTVGAVSSTQDGFHGPGPIGDLSEKTFSVGTSNYTIRQVTVANSTATNPGDLLFSLMNTALTAADRAKLVLHVDGITDTFAFSAATEIAYLYQWTGTSLDWSSETSVTLRLRRSAPQEPGKPTNLMAEPDGSTRIDLSWTAPADDGGSDITGYRIEVSPDGSSGSWTELEADTGDDATGYTHEGLSAGDTRHYRVSAINAEGRSEASNVANATTMPEDPAADASLSALTVSRSGGVTVPLHPDFASDETDYAASVANAVDEVTVTAVAAAAAAGATLAYLDGDGNALPDADTGTAGHQVALDVGDTVVRVKVTAADTTTTRTYTVTVTRRAADAPGVEGEWRLTDVASAAEGGVTGRAEVFHAGAWGTVCSDGIERSEVIRFQVDVDGNFVVDDKGNLIELDNQPDNVAAALICKAQPESYDNGAYHEEYGDYRPGQAEADHQESDYWPPDSLYSGAAKPIWIDDLRCAAGEAALTGTGALPGAMSHCNYAGWGLHNCAHREDAVVRCWDEDTSAGRTVGPLTAAFADLPARHEGTAFTFRLEFSEDVAVSAADMRDHALTVTGGAVTDAAQVDGRADRWSVTVTPSGAAEVLISLPPGRDCSEAGAVCTSDGRKLSTGLAEIVPGPPANAPAQGAPTIAGTARVGETLTASTADITDADGLDDAVFAYQWLRGGADIAGATGSDYAAADADEGETLEVRVEFEDDAGHEESLTSAATDAVAARADGAAPLTAEFVDLPAAHDGESAFTFRIAFSERVAWMNGGRLREDVVAVAGGRATAAGRVDRRRDLWEMTVEPESEADVTVTVAAGAACRTPAAVCTSDGRALSETISATVAGPADEAAENTPAQGAPTIAGTARVGETLTATTSDITDADGLANAVFAYQWLRGGADISGATGSEYAAVEADEGETLEVRVEFEDDAGHEESLTSAATDAVAARADGAAPLTGRFEGLPSEHDGSAFTFRIAFSEQVGWMNGQRLREDVVAVSGGRATAADRVDRRRDLWEVTVAPDSAADVTVTMAAGAACRTPAAVCTSDGRALAETISATVAGPEGTAANAPAQGAPTIAGTARVGETLSASTSGISDADGLDDATFAYQWIRDGADISGATGRTYTAVDADEGARLKVRVGFTDDAGHAESVTSAATDAVAARPNAPAGGAPTIAGTAQVGETLTASTSGISDADGLANATFAYQWIRDGADISGAAGRTYTAVDADEGARLKVRVGFTDDAGHAESVTSAATDAVAARPNAPAGGAPTIAGTAQVGETLTASTSGITDADGLDNATFTYQWIRGGADIAGATGRTYTAVDADEGERLKVRVGFTDDAGHAESLTSAATDAVAARPSNTPAEGRPEIAGKARVGETLTATTSGITDADGLDNAAFAYQWIRGSADISGATSRTYAAADADEGERLKVRVEFTDDAGHDESLTSGSTRRVAARPLPKASVADARVREAAGATLDFAVTLSFPPPGPVTVDYRTLDASAKAGEDYEAAEGTLSFAAGETAQTLRVTVLDDDVDEGDEKMVVLLDPGPGVARGDRLGSGTIENSDPLPEAWLVRFGRTASDHAVEAIEARFRDPGGASHATFGGRRLWGGGGLFDAPGTRRHAGRSVRLQPVRRRPVRHGGRRARARTRRRRDAGRGPAPRRRRRRRGPDVRRERRDGLRNERGNRLRHGRRDQPRNARRNEWCNARPHEWRHERGNQPRHERGKQPRHERRHERGNQPRHERGNERRHERRDERRHGYGHERRHGRRAARSAHHRRRPPSAPARPAARQLVPAVGRRRGRVRRAAAADRLGRRVGDALRRRRRGRLGERRDGDLPGRRGRGLEPLAHRDHGGALDRRGRLPRPGRRRGRTRQHADGGASVCPLAGERPALRLGRARLRRGRPDAGDERRRLGDGHVDADGGGGPARGVPARRRRPGAGGEDGPAGHAHRFGRRRRQRGRPAGRGGGRHQPPAAPGRGLAAVPVRRDAHADADARARRAARRRRRGDGRRDRPRRLAALRGRGAGADGRRARALPGGARGRRLPGVGRERLGADRSGHPRPRADAGGDADVGRVRDGRRRAAVVGARRARARRPRVRRGDALEGRSRLRPGGISGQGLGDAVRRAVDGGFHGPRLALRRPVDARRGAADVAGGHQARVARGAAGARHLFPPDLDARRAGSLPRGGGPRGRRRPARGRVLPRRRDGSRQRRWPDRDRR